jgi:hypothetical protein
MKLNPYMAYLRVAVDEYDDGRIAGHVYSQRLKEPIRFKDTADLLLQIEELLDEQNFPRAFQKKRTFGKAAQKHAASAMDNEGEGETMGAEQVDQVRGAVATFALNVITRQNTSWQGYLDLLDGSAKKAFNSDLELLSMIMGELKI